jgi:AbrB family looped-hinge helix DNA binding protein
LFCGSAASISRVCGESASSAGLGLRVIGAGMVADTARMTITAHTIPYEMSKVRNMDEPQRIISRIARVTSKGQVTIPKDIREALDIRDGDAVEFWIRGDELRVERIKRVNELHTSVTTPDHAKGMTWKEIRRHAIDTHVADKAAKWKRQELEEKQERGE